MDKASKEKLVANYSKLFNNYEAIFLIKNSGLSVLDSKSIRSQFKKIDSKFMVAKNSLAKIALKDTKFSSIHEHFTGPIAVAYSDDPVSASKLLIKFCEQNDKIDVVSGAILDKTLNKEEVIALSKMLTQEEIRAKIIGLVNAAASKVVRVLNEPGAKLARVIKAYAEKQ
ncbi:50S ribosomal protein L10 [Candidatus Aquarickettsia rohweri]|uniref:50S ribosomal protein L10 n=1 Tax=Candidatus Aquarickettsia rohweri TaxID=2602574 RepID=UPI0013902C93|nr:50S ribosomal protein L10 [Candidatus Aquarickettsia rohweri]